MPAADPRLTPATAVLPTASPAGSDALRRALLSRVFSASSATPEQWAALEAEWAAEDAALEASDSDWEPPSEEDLAELGPDPDCGPPDGDDAWLVMLPDALREEYFAATARPGVPEAIEAGFWDRGSGDGCGFASGGSADTLAPGPVLAGLADRAWTDGLGRLTDDELIGVLRAGRRLSSWAAALEIAATADLTRRRVNAAAAAGDSGVIQHMSAEVAAALTLTARAADELIDLAAGLEGLPATMSALRAGQIDRRKAAVIADETSSLSPAHRVAVERHVIRRAPEQTTGELRAAVRRAVISADPAAARTRQEKAQRDARVERWTETDGTAALAGRDLPPAGVLAADQYISGFARRLKGAGLDGTMDQLRARVFLGLLAGQSPESLLPHGPGRKISGTPEPQAQAARQGRQGRDAQAGGQGRGARQGRGMGGRDASRAAGGPGKAGAGGDRGAASRGNPGHVGLDHPGPAGVINFTLPLSTWLGPSELPGDVAGYGPLGAADSRDLVARLAANPATRWCLTLTGVGGYPVAHGCTATPPRASGAGPPSGAGGTGPAPSPGPRRSAPETGGARSPAGAAGPRPRPVSGRAGPLGSTASHVCPDVGGPPRSGGEAGLPALSVRPGQRRLSEHGCHRCRCGGWRPERAATAGSRRHTGRRRRCSI